MESSRHLIGALLSLVSWRMRSAIALPFVLVAATVHASPAFSEESAKPPALVWEYAVNPTGLNAPVEKAAWKPFTNWGDFRLETGRQAGVLWMRTRFEHRHSGPLALYLGRVSVAEVTYLGDVRVGGSGRFPARISAMETDYFSTWNEPRGYVLPPELLRAGQPNELRIQIFWNQYGYIERADLMTTSQMVRTRFWDRLIHHDLRFGLIFVLVSVAVYYLLLFIRRPRDRENAFFALACVGAAVEVLNFCLPEMEVDWLNKERFFFGNQPLLGLWFSLFFQHFFGLRSRAWFAAVGVVAVCSVAAVVWLAVSPDIAEINQRRGAGMALLGVSLLFTMVCTLQGLRSGHRNARAIAVSFLIVWGLAAHDVFLVLARVGNSIYLFSYALPIFLGNLALIQANDFFRTRNEIEELNEKLEERVAERTAQLRQSLTHVQELKTQQDGDYFLTSLLLGPLATVTVEDPRVHVETLVRQRKSFQFRHWQAELGGDLCSAVQIRLRDRPFVFFVQGDAMGKSIQGAGGAIVLGTAVKSIVARTLDSPSAQDTAPELFLKHAFSDLQEIFLTFDGLMLVSAVLGLLDPENGMLYYVNAEHPAMVVLRNGRASFLPESELRKLGIAEVAGDLRVGTFRMVREDVLLVGSDGRDDIVIGTDSSGRRRINENEQLFLESVEQARGDLRSILQSLSDRGEIMDDLSLLRVGYLEDSLPQPEQADGAEERANAREHLRAGRFAEAATLLLGLCERFPWEDELLHLCAQSLKGLRRLPEALEFAERCRLRAPEHVGNLVNLADAYRLLGRKDRARAMWERAAALQPDHAGVQKLGERLNPGAHHS